MLTAGFVLLLKWCMRKLLLVTAFIFGFLLVGTTTVHAAVVEKNLSRSYTLYDDYVEVEELLSTKITDSRFFIPSGQEETFLIFNPIVNDTQAQTKIEKTTPTIEVTDANGNKRDFTTRIDGQHLVVTTSYPSETRVGKKSKLKIKYKSYALSSQTGAIRDMYVPSFSKDFEFSTGRTALNVGTTVLIPKDYGNINIVTPEKQAETDGINWIFNFSQQELTGTISWIQIGTTQYYEFEITQPYSQSSSIPLFYNTYKVMLPRDVTAGPVTQTVNYTSISPAPYEVEQDEFGNLIGVFRVPATNNGEITLTGYIEVSDSKNFSFEDSGTLADIPQNIIDSYTQPGKFWEVNAPEIQAKAMELKGEETDIYKILSKTYKYVVDQIDYSEVKRFGLNERQGALKTLQGGGAVCMEYSDLFIALMRAQGVPARAAFGYGYDPRSTDGVDTAHQWAEVYLPTHDTWVLVDTTWGESGTDVIGGDLNHFYKYVAGVDPQTPAPVEAKFFGGLESIPDEEFTITAVEQAPQVAGIQTEADLIRDYPAGDANVILEVWQGLSLGISTVNSALDIFIVEQLQLPIPALQWVIKILILISPALLYLGVRALVRSRQAKSNGKLKTRKTKTASS